MVRMSDFDIVFEYGCPLATCRAPVRGMCVYEVDDPARRQFTMYIHKERRQAARAAEKRALAELVASVRSMPGVSGRD